MANQALVTATQLNRRRMSSSVESAGKSDVAKCYKKFALRRVEHYKGASLNGTETLLALDNNSRNILLNSFGAIYKNIKSKRPVNADASFPNKPLNITKYDEIWSDIKIRDISNVPLNNWLEEDWKTMCRLVANTYDRVVAKAKRAEPTQKGINIFLVSI
jgi:hypothetical protein